MEDKVRICSRSYRLLVDKANFASNDIIFDPNILTIGTGCVEHDNYGAYFIESIPLIKNACPGLVVVLVVVMLVEVASWWWS